MSLFDFFNKKNKSYGLVLSGGGARGYFHIGVIKAIQELKIPITEVSGTSIGAIVGAIYCANPNVNFDEIISNLSFIKVIKLIKSHTDKNPSSKLEDFLKDIIKINDFKDFKIPFKFNATDINTGQEIIFSKGEIFPYLLSSSAIPGVFPPQKVNDTFLVDGGVINNIPISLIKNNTNIIISDVSVPIKKISEKSKVSDIIQSSFTIMQRSNSLSAIKNSSYHKNIKHIIFNNNNVFALDFRKKHSQNLIDQGYFQTIDLFNHN